ALLDGFRFRGGLRKVALDLGRLWAGIEVAQVPDRHRPQVRPAGRRLLQTLFARGAHAVLLTFGRRFNPTRRGKQGLFQHVGWVERSETQLPSRIWHSRSTSRFVGSRLRLDPTYGPRKDAFTQLGQCWRLAGGCPGARLTGGGPRPDVSPAHSYH